MSEIHWAFQYYFGRYPDPAAQDFFRHNGIASADTIRDTLSQSAENAGNLHGSRRFQGGTFFQWNVGAQKVCVLGNCQAPGIARAIAHFAQQPLSVAGLEIMSISNYRAEILAVTESADVILACKTYSPEYSALSAATLRERYKKRVIEYSPLHFCGLHPDISILGTFQRRLLCPLGAYNSAIILSSYLHGLTELECLRVFNEATYRAAGFYTEFTRSENEFYRREELLQGESVRIASWFFDELKRTPLLLNVNHPTSSVFAQYAARFLDLMDLEVADQAPDTLPNLLTTDAIWPVLPEIAQEHHLTYKSAPIFWQNMVALSLEEFVRGSYKSYEKCDAAELRYAAGDRLIGRERLISELAIRPKRHKEDTILQAGENSSKDWGQEFVRLAYVGILGRPADNSGLEHYTRQMLEGALRPDDVLKALMAGPEYAAKTMAGQNYNPDRDPVFANFVTSYVKETTTELLAHETESVESFERKIADYTENAGKYYDEHKRHFLETVNAIGFLFVSGRLTPGARLLEFGGSHLTAGIISTYFGDKCNIASANLTRSGWLDHIVKEQFTVNLESDEIDKCRLSDELFDIISFCEVIERLRNNPERIFKFLASNLKPGGYLYLTTPNFYRQRHIINFAARLPMQPVVPIDMPAAELHSFHVREYCANEIFQYAAGEGLQLTAFYFSACWDADDPLTPIENEERANMVFLFRK